MWLLGTLVLPWKLRHTQRVPGRPIRSTMQRAGGGRSHPASAYQYRRTTGRRRAEATTHRGGYPEQSK